MVHSSLLALAQAAKRAATAPRSRKSAVDLTEAAVHRIKQLLDVREKVGHLPLPPAHATAVAWRPWAFTGALTQLPRVQEFLRLGVKRRGCNGLAYTLNYADKPERFDELVESGPVKVLIDPGAIMHVVGTTMDYVEDRLRSEFVFVNPKATGHCGCGESFTTNEPAGSCGTADGKAAEGSQPPADGSPAAAAAAGEARR